MLVRSSESWLSTMLGRVGVEDVAVGVDAVEQVGQPQPQLVEVGVGADVGLVLLARREVPLGTEPGAGEQDLADLEQQQRDRRCRRRPRAAIACSATQEALDLVGDLLGELVALGRAAAG